MESNRTVCKHCQSRKVVKKSMAGAVEVNLSKILTEMHKRMLQLKDERLSKTEVKEAQIRSAIPLLADRIGLVKLKDWSKFERNLQSRIRRQKPRKPMKGSGWYYKILGEASNISKELTNAKDWSLNDLTELGKWLDSQHWGVGELRDKDRNWILRYESIRPFMLDDTLRTLINSHIDYSYGVTSTMLLYGYSVKYPQNQHLKLLYSTLAGSSISPVQIDTELSEVLGSIDKKLKAQLGE